MVDLTSVFFNHFQESLKKAELAKGQKKTSVAAKEYHDCARSLRQYAESFRDPTILKQWLSKAEEYEKLAVNLENQVGVGSGGKALNRVGMGTEEDSGSEEDQKKKEILALVQRTNVKWDDVGGLDYAKESIKTAYAMALARMPEGIQAGDSGRNNILLYGPPGTGKTLLAAAAAGSIQATFFNIKLSNVVSKYVGESDKFLSMLFAVARENSPAIVAMDEFESLSPPRETTENRAYSSIVSTLNMELDGIATKGDTRFMMVMAAVNFPWILDPAILSRFKRQIYVSLPDPDTRKVIFEIQLNRRGIKTGVPMDDLVTRSELFSGRDIENLCQTAVSHMIHRANPGLLDLVDRGLDAIQKYTLNYQALSEEDFQVAFEKTRPGTPLDLLARYQEWGSSYQ